MANANTITNNRNIFVTVGRNVAAIVAAGTLALGLSGCDNGNSQNEDIKPLPSPSQIDTPTTNPEPSTPAAQETDPTGDPCVDHTFMLSNGYSDIKSAIECLDGSDRKVSGTGSVKDLDGDGKDEIFLYTSGENFILGGDGVLRRSDYYTS